MIWLLHLMGLSQAASDTVVEVQWRWHQPAYLWIGAVLAGPLAWFIASRQKKNQSHIESAARHVMVVCRVGFMLLLMVVLAGPYLLLREDLAKKPVLVMLIDESQSMSLPAEPASASTNKPAPITRAELLQRTLESNRATLDALERAYELRGFRFARTLRAVDSKSLAASANKLAAAEAAQSAIGSAIEDAVGPIGEKPLAAILLLTDGQTNAGPNPANIVARLQTARTQDRRGGAPVLAFAAGSKSPLPDVALVDVFSPGRITLGDTASFIVTLTSSAVPDKPINLTLRNGDIILDRQSLTIRHGQRQQVQLSTTPKSIGSFSYTIDAEPMSEEVVLENNHLSAPLDVTDDKLKILYLEYGPRWDFRFLDHALRRDRGIEVTFTMQAQLEGDGISADQLPAAARLPTSADEFSRYDLIILGDISPALLPPQLQEQLLTAITERGVGLIVQPGTQHMPEDFAAQPLARAMPVVLTPASADATHGRFAPRLSPFTMSVTAEGAAHPAFQLHETASQNRAFWSNLAPFYWAVSSQEAKPGATILANVIGPGIEKPLIAEHFLGRGRVLMIGTDCTFLWRRNVGDRFFYRFWGQAIRRTARDPNRATDRSWLHATPHHLSLGDPVAIELFCVDRAKSPSLAQSQRLQIRGETNTTLTLARTAQAGLFSGQWVPTSTGRFDLQFNDDSGASLSATINVEPSTHEFSSIQIQRESLIQLAEASAGQLLELDEFARLPSLIQPFSFSVPFTHEEELWDNWVILVLLVSLYCTDIGIRRFKGAS